VELRTFGVKKSRVTDLIRNLSEIRD